MDIDKIIENINSYTIDEFFNLWKDQKDVFIIKYDGLREVNKYTIILMAHKNRFDSIIIECEEILCGIEDILVRYKDKLHN